MPNTTTNLIHLVMRMTGWPRTRATTWLRSHPKLVTEAAVKAQLQKEKAPRPRPPAARTYPWGYVPPTFDDDHENDDYQPGG
ncbi:hypothetical protein [Janibacter anophelis]|uniref:hypothetical protein n=1 Tax=Janibacter anophelis TaxID=319054 RepID=UPI000830F82A|nr:hypothetical protein [Janibacter anophelis]